MAMDGTDVSFPNLRLIPDGDLLLSPARRASISAIAVSATRRASFGGISNSFRRTSVPNISSDLQGIVEGEHFVDEAELFDTTPSGSGKKSKSRRRSDAAVDGQEEKEKVVEPSAEEKKEAFRSFLNETLKSVFDLIMVNDKINITIDNVFPLMKTLELDTKDEAILDMVRTSCIETFGDIDEEEFDTAIVDLRKRSVGEDFEDDMRSAFNLIDYDEDGFITTSDIYQLMMGLGEMLTDYELDDLLKAADKDRDGKISYKDFKLFLVGEWTEEDEIRENGVDIAEEEENEEKKEETKDNGSKEGKAENVEETTKPSDKEEIEEEKKDGNYNQEEKGEEKMEEEEKEKVKPSPKSRNSLLWGYLSSEKEEESDAMTKYLQQLEAKEKEIENIKAENENGNKETSDDNEDELKEKNDEKLESPKEEEGSTPVIDDKKEDGDVGSSVKCIDDVEHDTDSKPPDDIDNDSKPPGHVDDDLKCRGDVDEASKPPGDDDVEGIEDARSVISVTVKHLDSIMEEGEDDQDHGHVPVSRPQSIRKSQLIRQSSSASLRIRPSSGLTESSIDAFGDDSGIDFIDGDDLKNEEVFDNFDDEGVYSRENSAKDRVLSAKSRGYHSQNSHICQSIEEAPKDGFWEEDVPNEGQRSVSTQLNFYASDPVIKEIIKSKSHRLHLCTENNGSIGPYYGKREADSSIDLESDISVDQSTKVSADRKTQESSNKRLHVQNLVVNHSYCEAGVEEVDTDRMEYGDELDVDQNFRPYSAIRRPRTAVTFKEAKRRGMTKSTNEEYSKYDSGIDSPDTDDDKGVSIVDLSQRLNTQFGELEAPNQSLQHHGYKSVWPLARVMAAYNNKYNEGKSMQLNSISRRLERREIPVCWNERENPNITFRERPQTARETFEY
ncbi:FK506-binding protein 5-like [Pecten maximus]|uniref:FK506-binding protein 5-like n=1 Tax=Pecten maximus TaxID=6579 RepID=UPI001458CBA0|nr:FK506-binding protein 5-like [Pecten maximus]